MPTGDLLMFFIYSYILNHAKKKCLGKETPHVKAGMIWFKISQTKEKEKKIYSVTVLLLRIDSNFTSLE